MGRITSKPVDWEKVYNAIYKQGLSISNASSKIGYSKSYLRTARADGAKMPMSTIVLLDKILGIPYAEYKPDKKTPASNKPENIEVEPGTTANNKPEKAELEPAKPANEPLRIHMHVDYDRLYDTIMNAVYLAMKKALSE